MTVEDQPEQIDPAGAVAIVRRGLQLSPRLKWAALATIIVGVLTSIGRLAVPVLFQQVIDRGLLAEGGIDRGVTADLLLAATGIIAFVGIAAFLVDLVLIRLAERALADLRVRVLDKALDLSLAEHATERRGDLLTRVTGDLDMVSRFLEWGAFTWIVDGMLILLASAAMIAYSPPLGILVVVVMAVTVPIIRFIQRRQQQGYTKVRDRTGALLGDASETIGGIDVIRALGHADATTDNLDEAVDEAYTAQLEVNRYTAVLFTVADVFGAVAMAAVIVIAASFGPGWGLGLGEIVAFLFLVSLVLTPIGELTEVMDQTARAIAGWGRAVDLLDRPIVLREPADPAALPSGPLSIDVENMTFEYVPGEPILRDITLHVDAGTSVAIVGATGSGKTTFVRLLCRLADPTHGVVRLGGVDLKAVASDDRRRRVRMVPQDGFLFATSILENVQRGRPGASRDDALRAASMLGLDDWLDGLSDGLDTPLGPRGQGLSVGERQLVALIRAQLADPGLLVLDEATSSLDPVTEQAMSEALERIARGRTTISVAHRLSTAERADRVLVFDSGELVEDGAHHELLDAGGRYADLHAAWRRGTTVD